jgi:hypothetical protein
MSSTFGKEPDELILCLWIIQIIYRIDFFNRYSFSVNLLYPGQSNQLESAWSPRIALSSLSLTSSDLQIDKGHTLPLTLDVNTRNWMQGKCALTTR